MPPKVFVQSSPNESGRKMFLKQGSVTEGDLLHTGTPLFLTLNSELLKSHCSGCLKTAEYLSEELNISLETSEKRMLKCERCKTHIFCSARCYARSWLRHVNECRAIAKVPRSFHTTLTRLMVQVLLKRRSQKVLNDPLPNYPGVNSTPFRSSEELKFLTDNVVQLLGDRENDEGVRVKVFKPENYHMESDDDLKELARRVSSCLFTVYDNCASPVGICLSPELSEMRHSCKPNSQIVWNHTKDGECDIQLVAIKDISLGEEITISYIDLSLPLHFRQEALVPFDFDHFKICPSCPRVTDDPRWCIAHRSCTREGMVLLPPVSMHELYPELGSIGQNSTKKKNLCGVCGRCKQKVLLDKVWARYANAFSCIENSMDKEKVGMLLPSFDAGKDDIKEEIEFISATLTILKRMFAPTVYPIPYLQFRLGRLITCLDKTIPDILTVIDLWKESHSSFSTLNDGTSTPLTYYLSIKLVGIHITLVKRHRELIDNGSKPKIEIVADEDKTNPRGVEDKSKISKAEIEIGKPGWIDVNWMTMFHYLGDGRDWIKQSTDDLLVLGYEEDSIKFEYLHQYEEELDDLDIWLDGYAT